MEENKKKDGRGGARPGAGRPRTDSKLITFRAPGYMVRKIESQSNKTDFIRSCIEMTIRREPDFSRLGEVYPATELSDITLPYFENINVVAGFPVPLDNDEKAQSIELINMLCPHAESCYLIRVKGDSMIDADIHSGDIIIVDKSNRNPTPDEVAMCELNGEYTIKHFEKRGETAWLVPANRNYPEIPVTESDDFSIWGVITYVIHKPSKG